MAALGQSKRSEMKERLLGDDNYNGSHDTRVASGDGRRAINDVNYQHDDNYVSHDSTRVGLEDGRGTINDVNINGAGAEGGIDSDEGGSITEAEIESMREEEEARVVKAVNLAIKSAGHVSNLLPAGTLLVFQVMLPVLSHDGQCGCAADRVLTAALLASCALACFLLAFTDTFRSPADGRLYHGLATPRGIWSPATWSYPNPPRHLPADPSRYRLRPIDFVHASLSLTVFAACAIFTPNVTSCFFSSHQTLVDDLGRLQDSLPLAVGFVASFFCILFPSHRRSLDQPLIENPYSNIVSSPEA